MDSSPSSSLSSLASFPRHQHPLLPPSRRPPPSRLSFRPIAPFRNVADGKCASFVFTSVCGPSLVHMAITLDMEYLRGSIVAVHSILQHSQCLENIFFHFLIFETNLESLVKSTFSQLNFKAYYFDPKIVRNLISTSVKNYLTDLLEPCVERVIYLDSDLVLVNDISNFRILEFPLYREFRIPKF
ncbi:putative galacturonosyltransferase-like 7 [Glycine soja]|uniref:probable galacturonosyltransferase-like 7 n=1 Tax=Glycine soja TaxID=3848 RepID=UPI00103CCC77|nr:probable galacturonosyltransferase-like 7 [Glycine soja]